jgi:hypothetical protein
MFDTVGWLAMFPALTMFQRSPFRFAVLLAVLTWGAVASRAQTVTINFGAKSLFNSAGSLLPDGTLFILVADTLGNGFGTAQAGSLAIGNFISGDDQIIGHGFTEISSGSAIGSGSATNVPLGTGAYSQFTTGDSLAVMWFPGLTTSSFSLTSGASYGYFRTNSPSSGAAWTVPSAGQSVSIEELNLLNDTGAMSGRALLTAIPEPSTYAAICGLAMLGFAAFRRARAS